MNGMAQVIGALLSYGLGNVTNLALPNWKLIFIAIGALTLLWAIILVLWMPDGPHNGKMFSEYERIVAVWRIRNNRTGVQNSTFLSHQLKEASIDPKSYILLLMAAAYGILNGCVTNFASELIEGFGFSGLQANLLQTPGGAFQIFTNIGFGFLATLPNMLGVSNFLACIPGTAGLIGMLLIPNSQRWALVACSWLQGGLGPCIVLNWTLPSVNVAGHTKRTTVMGLYFAFYCAGNISSPHLFIPSEAPRYKTALKGLVGTYSVAMFLQLLYTGWCYMNNRDRNKQFQQEGSHEQQVEGDLEGFEDFTDKENKHFRYRL
ncbi:uncharacterized protein PFLUO_LOCUS8143 [Penicillium psychrofluorescens]|uniref:uncharacterized protein n=1 Tax=Penicillium psychrofluorescens TaxID=3158075 RepID=UPI003CCDD9F9